MENDKPHQLDGYTAIKVWMKGMLSCQTIQKLCSRNSTEENNQFTYARELELYKSVHTHSVCMITTENENSSYRVTELWAIFFKMLLNLP